MIKSSFDKAFIGRLKSGDQKTITEWYDHASPWLLGISLRYANNLSDAEDWLHQAMMSMLKALPDFSYTFPGSFEAWMRKIMINTALNQVRNNARKKIQLESLDEAFVAEYDEEMNEALPDANMLIEWIQNLPIGYRTVLNLFVFEEYSHKQISIEMGISENTSKSQLSKARALLRKQAADYYQKKEMHQHG
jgi:RNA polymerase sigma-70 factor (ECF subfamily)